MDIRKFTQRPVEAIQGAHSIAIEHKFGLGFIQQ